MPCLFFFSAAFSKLFEKQRKAFLCKLVCLERNKQTNIILFQAAEERQENKTNEQNKHFLLLPSEASLAKLA
jgi:hypothetical protein